MSYIKINKKKHFKNEYNTKTQNNTNKYVLIKFSLTTY